MSLQIKTSATRLSPAKLSERLRHAAGVFASDARLKSSTLTAATILQVADALDEAIRELFVAKRTLKERAVSKRQRLKVAQQTYSLLGAIVYATSNGDPTLVLEAGLDVRGPQAPLPPPLQPEHVITRPTKRPGEARLRWASVKGCTGYHVERSNDPSDPGRWVWVTTVTRTSLDVEDLPSGVRVWFRVAATGTRGESPYSDMVSCMPA